MSNQAVKLKDKTVKQWLNDPSVKQQVQRALPRSMDADRAIRSVLTATIRCPQLLDADKDSLSKALMDLSTMGLMADGRHAHLVPFKNRKRGIVEVVLIPDYKGLIQLVNRSQNVLGVRAHAVYSNEPFDWKEGTGAFVDHTPIMDEEARGELLAAYAIATMQGGFENFKVLTKPDIEKVRKNAKGSDKPDSPWNTHTDQMYIKTAFRNLCKWLPLEYEIEECIERFDKDEFDYNRPIKNVTPPRPQLFGGSDENFDDESNSQIESSSEPAQSGSQPGMGDKSSPDQPADAAPLKSLRGGIRLKLEAKGLTDKDLISYLDAFGLFEDVDKKPKTLAQIEESQLKAIDSNWEATHAKGIEEFTNEMRK